MTRVAAYCRVSTDLEDQANSFESQKLYFQQYIESRADWTFYEIYADEGISGTSAADRTGFQIMISDALEGKFELILTKEVSRFSRNILDAVAYTRRLRGAGVGVIFMNDGISTLDQDAELRLGIMASVAQEESRKTSERVKWGQRRRMERGVVFGPSLLGYHVRGGQISVEPAGAETVKTIFGLCAGDGYGVRRIAEALTRRGIPTASGKKAWSGGAVLKILRNEKYCGDLRQRKTIIEDYLTHKKSRNKDDGDMICIRDHHEPIVSRDVWEKAQSALERRTSAGQPRQGRGSLYPLSGKIRCSGCGAVFLCRTRIRRDGSRYRVWRRPCACDGRPRQVREDDLGLCVRRFVAAIGAGPLLDGFGSVLEKAAASSGEGRGAVLRDISTSEQKLVRLAEAYISGDVGREAYLKLRDALDKSLEKLREKLSQMIPENKEEETETMAGMITALAAGEDQDGGFYLSLLESVAIRPDGADIRLYGLPEPLRAVFR